MKLIVGLGNPGAEYAGSRHNLGFGVIDAFKWDKGNWGNEGKFKSDIVKTSLEGQDLLLAKPQTFMNASGEAVSLIVNFYKIKPEDVLVIHDDLDIPLGTHKLQFGKGPVGHNGILDIEQKLGTKDFWRLRIGVDGREGTLGEVGSEGEGYVLGKFSKEELAVIEKATPQILERLGGWVTGHAVVQ